MRRCQLAKFSGLWLTRRSDALTYMPLLARRHRIGLGCTKYRVDYAEGSTVGARNEGFAWGSGLFGALTYVPLLASEVFGALACLAPWPICHYQSDRIGFIAPLLARRYRIGLGCKGYRVGYGEDSTVGARSEGLVRGSGLLGALTL